MCPSDKLEISLYWIGTCFKVIAVDVDSIVNRPMSMDQTMLLAHLESVYHYHLIGQIVTCLLNLGRGLWLGLVQLCLATNFLAADVSLLHPS